MLQSKQDYENIYKLDDTTFKMQVCTTYLHYEYSNYFIIGYISKSNVYYIIVTKKVMYKYIIDMAGIDKNSKGVRQLRLCTNMVIINNLLSECIESGWLCDLDTFNTYKAKKGRNGGYAFEDLLIDLKGAIRPGALNARFDKNADLIYKGLKCQCKMATRDCKGVIPSVNALREAAGL